MGTKELEDLSDEELMRLLAKGWPERYGGLQAKLPTHTPSHPAKKPFPHDIPDLSPLPPGQRRAVQALVGGVAARTYPSAAQEAGMSLGTLHTHIRRVRQGHPSLYGAIRKVRLAQLAERHEVALEAARDHSRAYFRKRARWMRRMGLG